MTPLRIGTRASALALAQARLVADALGEGELVEITTSGDRGVPGGDKSRWVAELESALGRGEIDVAVHSAKDVPGELAPGLEIVAVPERADARDALLGAASLEELAPGARVGTSSLRRRAQLLAAREDLEVVELRGNVDTRLRRLAEGRYDALVLALAGLERLGRAADADAALDADAFVPAPGQGALALEARADDVATRDLLARLNHGPSWTTLLAERRAASTLGGSCHTPIGAHATISGPRLRLSAFVGLPDGSAWVRDELEGDAGDAEQLGADVAGRILAAGGRELLDQAQAAA